MADTPDTTTKQPLMSPEDWHKFEIEKTHEAMCTTEKKRQASFNLALLFSVILIVVVFSSAADKEITIPLVGISLSKWYAAELLVVLTSGAFFRTIAMHGYDRLITRKLKVLLGEIGKDGVPWNIQYPSEYELALLSESMGSYLLIAPLGIILAACGFVVPGYCICIVYSHTSLTASWAISAAAFLVFIVASLDAMRSFSQGAVDASLLRLEGVAPEEAEEESTD